MAVDEGPISNCGDLVLPFGDALYLHVNIVFELACPTSIAAELAGGVCLDH